MTPDQVNNADPTLVVASLLWSLPGDTTVTRARETIRAMLTAMVGAERADQIIEAAKQSVEEDR